jgi:YVTN family beta-propeller protein
MRPRFRTGHFAGRALLFLLLAGTACEGVGEDPAVKRAAPVTGLLSDQAVVFNPGSGKIYAVDALHGSVVVINTLTKVRTQVKVGDAPVAIAGNSVANRVYVADNGSGSITVLDGQTDTVAATVQIGSLPYVLAVNDATDSVYVSNTFNNLLSVIDGKTNKVHQLKAGSVNKILVDKERNLVYLLGYEDDYLTIVDGKTEQVRRSPIGAMHLWDEALDKSTGEVFVTRIENRDIAISDATLQKPSTTTAGNMPCAIRIDAKHKRIYVANYVDNTISVLDAASKKPIATIPVGERPQAIALDESADLIYVANTRSNSISVIDGAQLRVVATLPTGKNPYAIAVDTNHGGVYAADLSEQSVTAIDVSALRTHALERATP